MESLQQEAIKRLLYLQALPASVPTAPVVRRPPEPHKARALAQGCHPLLLPSAPQDPPTAQGPQARTRAAPSGSGGFELIWVVSGHCSWLLGISCPQPRDQALLPGTQITVGTTLKNRVI